eukprot:93044-Pyramimonas_sp.AAC.1
MAAPGRLRGRACAMLRRSSTEEEEEESTSPGGTPSVSISQERQSRRASHAMSRCKCLVNVDVAEAQHGIYGRYGMTERLNS